MTPQEVRMAVQVAGGTIFRPEATTDFPYRMYVAGWNVTVQGHKLLIGAGGARAPNGPNMMQDNVSCSVLDYDSNGAARAELNQWMAIAPSVSGPNSVIYDFEWDGLKHGPIPGGKAFRADSNAGKAWELTITGSGKFASVMLMHFLKPVPKP
jgi:hypothetical protein